MARHRFHHLVVESRSTLAVDPVARLLAALPGAPTEAPVDLRLETRAAQEGELAPRLPGPPALALDGLQLRVGGGAVEVCAPGARFTIDALPLPRAVGVVDPAALATLRSLDALALGPAFLALAAGLGARGVFLLRAAGLVLPGERAVLVVGLAGAGTSTLAAALVALGAELLGDGTVFVTRRDGAVRLLSLPRGPGPAEASAPAVILLPRLTGEPASRLESAGPADALGLLLESSVLATTRGLPGGAGHLPLLGALADGARVLHAELGLDLLADGAAVARRLVADLADA